MTHFRTTLWLAAAAALAACSAGGNTTPGAPSADLSRVAAPSTIAGARGPVTLHPDRSPSQMDPQAAKGALLYVSDMVRGRVYAYTYPAGKKAGSIGGFDQPQGMCVDAAGNLFVTNTGTAQVLEYAHGGTAPVATLEVTGMDPIGCAVDVTTGNLAVTSLTSNQGGPGSVAIYAGGTGKAKFYQSKAFQNYYFAGYDNAGNLFVDGTAIRTGMFALGEIAAGSKDLVRVNLKGASIGVPGGVQYDGTNLAVGDQTRGVVYQISGTSIKGSTFLTGACDVAQFFIDNGQLIAPNLCPGNSGNVLFFSYPKGGKATQTINNIAYPMGAVVSGQ